MSALPQPAAEPSLTALLAEANYEHEQTLTHAIATVQHALRCGEVLTRITEQLSEGSIVYWLDAHFDGGPSTAYTYMRMYRHQDKLPAGISMKQARLLLRTFDGSRQTHDSFTQDEARRMREDGVSYKQIAKQLGVSPGTVHRWINGANPNAQVQRRKERQALERWEREQSIRAAVRKQGGALAEAYAMAERMQDVLGQAHREAEGSDCRMRLSLAGEHYRKMRDEIVRALGVQ